MHPNVTRGDLADCYATRHARARTVTGLAIIAAGALSLAEAPACASYPTDAVL